MPHLCFKTYLFVQYRWKLQESTKLPKPRLGLPAARQHRDPQELCEAVALQLAL